MSSTVNFFDALKQWTEEQIKDEILPTKLEKGETESESRPATVYLMALPNGHTATKFAPYILHKKVTSEDIIGYQKPNRTLVTVRSIFCVYNEDPIEGNNMLLNLMERLRISFLKHPVLYKRFRMYTGDDDGKISTVIYQEDIQPYYAGEMITVWEVPSVQEERIDTGLW